MVNRGADAARGKSENLGEAAMRVVVYHSMRVRCQRSVPYVAFFFSAVRFSFDFERVSCVWVCAHLHPPSVWASRVSLTVSVPAIFGPFAII